MKKIIYKFENIDEILTILMDSLSSNIICLFGDLGSGKTTLTTRILGKIGAIEKVSSPTFGLVHEYRNSDNKLIAYHFDCYRLESAEEALDLGLEEYLEADCWIFIEWPEKIAELLPAERSEIHMRIVDSNTRELAIQNFPA